MRFTYKEAYLIFRFENPKIIISLSSFYALRPGNIKALQNTPLLGCFCIYCSNVRLKLVKLNIPNIKNEYDLYKKLMCKKDCDKQDYSNARCIFNECSKCSKWESMLMKEASHNLPFSTQITWKAWDTEEIITKKN